MSTSEQEHFIMRVHQAHPGRMAQVWEQGVIAHVGGNSYQWLARQVAACASVLDVGGGSGACAAAAMAAHASGGLARWTTLDLSPDELALVDRRHSTPLRGRAQAIPADDASFDGVVSHLALTLMPDAAHILDELARVLRPGGTLALVVGGGPAVGSLLDSALDLALPYATPMPRLGTSVFRDPRQLAERLGPPVWSPLEVTPLRVSFARELVVPWVLSQYEFALLDDHASTGLAAAIAAHVAGAAPAIEATAAIIGVVARRIA